MALRHTASSKVCVRILALAHCSRSEGSATIAAKPSNISAEPGRDESTLIVLDLESGPQSPTRWR